MVCLWKRHPPHDASSYKRSQIRSPSHYLFLQQLSQQPRDLKTSQAPIMSLAWSFLFSLPFLLLLSTLNSVAFSVPVLRHRRSDTTTYNPPTESYEVCRCCMHSRPSGSWVVCSQYTVCKRDHLVITASSESDSFPFLTVPSDNQLSEVRLGAVNQKMSRKDLFSFESIDLQNHQWVLRTSDNSHLAIDDKGKLIVEVYIHVEVVLVSVYSTHLSNLCTCHYSRVCLSRNKPTDRLRTDRQPYRVYVMQGNLLMGSYRLFCCSLAVLPQPSFA